MNIFESIEKEKQKNIFKEIKIPVTQQPTYGEVFGDFSKAWDDVSQKVGEAGEVGFAALKRFGHSFREIVSIVGLTKTLEELSLETFGGKMPEGYKKMLEEFDKKPTTGMPWLDSAVDFTGSAVGTVFDYATIGKLTSPLFTHTPLGALPTQSGLRFGATRLAKTGLQDIAGEDIEGRDYLRAGLSGFVAGEAGNLLGEATKQLSVNVRMSDTVYPWVQKIVSGAGTGAGFTAVDYLFDPDETTVADLGINMASMALLYSLPLISPENRQAIQGARKSLIHSKALDRNARISALRGLGLSENATKTDIKSKWKEVSRKVTTGDLAGLTEGEKVKILADTKEARDTALAAIDKMSLPEKAKNIVLQKLNEVTTGISRKFTGLRPAGNLPVEQRAAKVPLASAEEFVKRVEAKPEQLPEQITAQEVTGMLIEPAASTEVLPGKVPPTKDITVAPAEPVQDIKKQPVESLEQEEVNIIETNKYGPLKVVDDTDPAMIKVENEAGTTFYIGRKFLEKQTVALPKTKDLPEEPIDAQREENLLKRQKERNKTLKDSDEVKLMKRQDPLKVPETEPVTRQEIEEFINLEMKVPVRAGKLTSPRAEGQYHITREVIRVRDYSNNEVTAHEIGHHLNKKLGLKVNQFSELKQLLKEEGLADAYPERLHNEEGAAEFFKYYFTDPSTAALKAPFFAAHLEEKLQQNPELNQQVKDLQNMMLRWETQPEEARIAGTIAKRPARQRKLLRLQDRFIKAWVAEDVVMQRALSEAGVDWEKDLEIGANPVKLRRLFASVNDKIDAYLTKKTLDPYGRPYMDSLLEVLSPVKEYIGEGDSVGEFEIYALARHALEREAKYIADNIGEIAQRESGQRLRFRQEDLKKLYEPLAIKIKEAIKADNIEELASLIKTYNKKTGKATGLRPDDIIEIVNKYEKSEEHPEFKETLKKLNKYQNNLVDYLVRSEMMTEEASNKIKESYSYHLPLYRLFGAGESYFEGTGGNKYASLPSPLKRAYGSTRIIKDPLRNIVRDTSYVIRQADKNRIALSLTRAIEAQKGTGWLVEDIPLPQEPHQFALSQVQTELKNAGLEDEDIENLDLDAIVTVFETQYYAGLKEQRENVVMVRDKGRIKAKQLHPELYSFLQDIDSQTASILGQLLKPIEIGANAFKVGAVLDPRFWIRNLGRDEFREAVYSKNGIQKLNIFKTIVDGVTGLVGMSKEDMEAMFRGAGGARAGYVSLLKDIENPDTVSKLLKNKDFSWNPLEMLGAASSWTEDVRRRGFFVQDLKNVDLNKLPPEEFEKKLLEAGYKARGGILEDYGIKGQWARVVDRYVPFFSAGITGSRHLLNKLKDPMTWLKGFAFITIPSIYLYLQNKDNPVYQELPQWRKIFAWNFILPNNVVISYPKPFSLGHLFGSIPEVTLEYINNEDPEMLREAAKNIFRFGAPNYQPAHLIPWLEITFDRRLESGIPLVPERERHLEPREQYSKWTSEIAKDIGNIINVSPRKIDHLIRGQFTSLGSSATELINFISGSQDFKETIGATLGLYNDPFTSSSSVDKFYRDRDKNKEIVETFRRQARTGKTDYTRQEVERAFKSQGLFDYTSRYISQLRKLEEAIDKANIPDEFKDTALSYVNILKINAARQVLGKELIDVTDHMEPKEIAMVRSLINSLGGN
jgi:hypothetical protein